MGQILINVEDVVAAISSKQYAAEKTALALAYSWNSQKNLILYGKGGYGKSEAAEIFGKLLLSKGVIKSGAYVVPFSQGTTEEKILGGLDIKKFNDSGELLYLIKRSFIEHELVVFEEFFDAIPIVLNSLKDILTRKAVIMDGEIYPIKTKMIVCCTNKSKEEVAIDDSTKALMERFVYEHRVEWTSWEESDYLESLKRSNSLAETDLYTTLVARICASASKSGDDKVSPRTCYHAYDSVKKTGTLRCLEFIGEIKNAALNIIKLEDSIRKDKEQETAIQSMSVEITNCINSIRHSNTLVENCKMLKKAIIKFEELDTISARDHCFELIKLKKRYCINLMESGFEEVKKTIKNPPKGHKWERLLQCKSIRQFDFKTEIKDDIQIESESTQVIPESVSI